MRYRILVLAACLLPVGGAIPPGTGADHREFTPRGRLGSYRS